MCQTFDPNNSMRKIVVIIIILPMRKLRHGEVASLS